MALIQNLKNKLGEIVYPITKPKAVIFDDGKNVEDKFDALPKVINNLDSTSSTDALSAAQGKALNDSLNMTIRYYTPDTLPGFDRSTSTLNTLCEGLLLPECATFEMFVNDESALGRSVRGSLTADGFNGNAIFGRITVHRAFDVWNVELYPWDLPYNFRQTFSAVNGYRWTGKWRQTA